MFRLTLSLAITAFLDVLQKNIVPAVGIEETTLFVFKWRDKKIRKPFIKHFIHSDCLKIVHIIHVEKIQAHNIRVTEIGRLERDRAISSCP